MSENRLNSHTLMTSSFSVPKHVRPTVLHATNRQKKKKERKKNSEPDITIK